MQYTRLLQRSSLIKEKVVEAVVMVRAPFPLSDCITPSNVMNDRTIIFLMVLISS